MLEDINRNLDFNKNKYATLELFNGSKFEGIIKTVITKKILGNDYTLVYIGDTILSTHLIHKLKIEYKEDNVISLTEKYNKEYDKLPGIITKIREDKING